MTLISAKSFALFKSHKPEHGGLSKLHFNAFQTRDDLGVFLVMTKNAFLTIKRDYIVNTYSRISTVPRGSERSK